MNVLFIGEDINRSRSGVVTVMSQILHDGNLSGKVKFKTIFTTGDQFSTVKKLVYWSRAYMRFLIKLPFCDIVHIHHASDLNFWLSGMMVTTSRFFNKRAILHNHSADFHEFYERSSSGSRRRICKLFETADVNIVLSKSWYTWYKGISPNANWFILQNAIQVPANVAPKVFNSEGAILVYLARIEARKGIFDLLNVMPAIIRQDPDCVLYIAGQGDIKNTKSIIDSLKLGKNVSILGHIDKLKRDEILRLGHILVFPSYNEGLPMSLLEAMSYGVVPVTTTVGGIPEVVTSGLNGILVEPGDENALTLAIISLLTDPGLYTKMSRAARNHIKAEFDFEEYGFKLLEVYKLLLSNKLLEQYGSGIRTNESK